MNPLKPPLGIFGGTFDPIHNGHIIPILAAAELTQIQSIALMPNYLPGYKQKAHSSSHHRLAMVKRLCQDYPIFYPESWEIEQAQVTYSINTLQAFKQRYPQTPLCFFIGSDSLFSLPSWHRADELLHNCHFIVCNRKVDLTQLRTSPHFATLQTWLNRYQTFDINDLHHSLAGHIYLCDTPLINISSTQIRASLANSAEATKLLPSAIYHYIQQYKLYEHR